MIKLTNAQAKGVAKTIVDGVAQQLASIHDEQVKKQARETLQAVLTEFQTACRHTNASFNEKAFDEYVSKLLA